MKRRKVTDDDNLGSGSNDPQYELSDCNREEESMPGFHEFDETDMELHDYHEDEIYQQDQLTNQIASAEAQKVTVKPHSKRQTAEPDNREPCDSSKVKRPSPPRSTSSGTRRD